MSGLRAGQQRLDHLGEHGHVFAQSGDVMSGIAAQAGDLFADALQVLSYVAHVLSAFGCFVGGVAFDAEKASGLHAFVSHAVSIARQGWTIERKAGKKRPSLSEEKAYVLDDRMGAVAVADA